MTVATAGFEETYAQVPALVRFAPNAPVTVGAVIWNGAAPNVRVTLAKVPVVGAALANVTVVCVEETAL